MQKQPDAAIKGKDGYNMRFDEIAKKIAEEEDNIIAKAFTIHISELLKRNGIIPVAERIKTKPEIVVDKNSYILTKEFGVTFNELDCEEHDKKVYNKAIDDFARKMKEFIFSEDFAPTSGDSYCYVHTFQVDEIAEQLKRAKLN